MSQTHSIMTGLGGSRKACRRPGDSIIIMSSAGDWTGVGDWTSIWATKENGALWGNGEMSMESPMGAGEDEGGRGGVVTYSVCSPTSIQINSTVIVPDILTTSFRPIHQV
jgi:hypothetical protein